MCYTIINLTDLADTNNSLLVTNEASTCIYDNYKLIGFTIKTEYFLLTRHPLLLQHQQFQERFESQPD